MRNALLITSAIGLSLFVSGCDTTSGNSQYIASTPNVLAIQGVLKPSGNTVKVGDIRSEGISEQSCRLVGGFDVTGGKSYASYIKDALQTELFTAQVYDVNSPITINGVLDEVRVHTLINGSWTLGLQITSSKDPVGYHARVVRHFKSSYIADSACKNAADAFQPTVRALLSQVINSPGFAKLAGETQ